MKPTKNRSCTGKVRHESQQAAWRHISKLRKFDGAVRMAPYRCKFCKQWHTGHYRNRKK